jgi:hypothetical protein
LWFESRRRHKTGNYHNAAPWCCHLGRNHGILTPALSIPLAAGRGAVAGGL